MWLKGVVMRAHYNGLIPRNPFAQFHICVILNSVSNIGKAMSRLQGSGRIHLLLRIQGLERLPVWQEVGTGNRAQPDHQVHR